MLKAPMKGQLLHMLEGLLSDDCMPQLAECWFSEDTSTALQRP
jgi:hypothetical protein